MSKDATTYNSLTPHDDLARLVAIDPWLAQKICLAVAQVVAQGYGHIEIIIKHHRVQMLYTTISEDLSANR
jgi:hypothetical protein